jgi:hypothetical protein
MELKGSATSPSSAKCRKLIAGARGPLSSCCSRAAISESSWRRPLRSLWAREFGETPQSQFEDVPARIWLGGRRHPSNRTCARSVSSRRINSTFVDVEDRNEQALDEV